MRTRTGRLYGLLVAVAVGNRAILHVIGEAAVAPFASSRTHRPVGLINAGNTCYLNAQLQCHFHIPRVRQLIMEEDPVTTPAEIQVTASSTAPSPEPRPASTRQQAVALQALRRLFQEMHQSPLPVKPSLLCSQLGINVYEQQDSQEFWKLLLPALDLRPLTDLYQGAYIDYIVALDGSNRERKREEPFLDLSLEVQSTGSVETALASLFGPPELLSAAQGNGWRPEKGADKVDAHKGSQLTSQGLPPILQLHLKRFHYDWNTDTTSKLNDPFRFPLQLDLASFCKEDAVRSGSPPPLYELQSIVVHVGEYGVGHYYSYVRPDISSERWYRFNDEHVDEVSWDEVIADASNAAKLHTSTGGGFLSRISRALFSSRTSHGYGGRTSSAYVLQYVRRSDLPMLYLENEL